MLLLGEEDADEVLRRLHAVCTEFELTGEEVALVSGGVEVLPLAGRGVALTLAGEGLRGELPETAMAEQVRQLLRKAVMEGRPFDLLVVDPLARFAGLDVEKDNAIATRLIQVIETFTKPEGGAPAVIVAHHFRKAGKNEEVDGADLIRGASALHDGARWAAVFAAERQAEGAPRLVRLAVVKSNYTAIPEALVLSRHERSGLLHVASPDELEDYRLAVSKRKGTKVGEASLDELVGQVREIVAAVAEAEKDAPSPKGISLERIREKLGKGKAATADAVHAAEAEGLIVSLGRKRGYTTPKSSQPECRTLPDYSGLESEKCRTGLTDSL